MPSPTHSTRGASSRIHTEHVLSPVFEESPSIAEQFRARGRPFHTTATSSPVATAEQFIARTRALDLPLSAIARLAHVPRMGFYRAGWNTREFTADERMRLEIVLSALEEAAQAATEKASNSKGSGAAK